MTGCWKWTEERWKSVHPRSTLDYAVVHRRVATSYCSRMAHQRAKKPSNFSPKLVSSLQLPKSWPSNVTFIDQPIYSSLLLTDTKQALFKNISDEPHISITPHDRGPSQKVRITRISNISHPANGQCGLFAAQHLQPSAFILPYIGFVHGENDTDPVSDYDISLEREFGVAIDATNMGNEARFTNDYRGIASGPNAEFRDIWVDMGRGKLQQGVGIFVLAAGKAGKKSKGIAKGEEILVSYGKGFWAGRFDSPPLHDGVS
ncbi:hypothetical protein EJ05DRAFT_484870 [Pseudovirgaria hyperparasitica]|uniref:SET domain-containing protein n=1 Tax=Pseudovirgaria hyperparasitica TaxID=470096 RepID=A0A6A6WBP4_9PEZI|nr:uncharacterized protein EJ05DRAFT_484870 [Pseudovirgaria hyperparasitica]KAF2759995.1 hypothetical protein EJ05DRAFT_484870 [Pseudovirgaria hyperparasitica]